MDSPLSRRRHQSTLEKCTPKLRAWIRTNATNSCGPNLAQCFSLLNENEQKYCPRSCPHAEPTAKRQQFPDIQVDHFVPELASVNRFFLVAQRVLNRLCQSLAGFANVHHSDDLLFYEAFFPSVIIRAVTDN